MQKTVYYLVHKDTQERLRYYKSLAGARIAQRSRNARLGFAERIERVELGDNWEVEQCLVDGHIVEATYCIVEDTIEQTDFYWAETPINTGPKEIERWIQQMP
jgi:hypothetical protein